jgi:hypothetical protein
LKLRVRVGVRVRVRVRVRVGVSDIRVGFCEVIVNVVCVLKVDSK